jgi:hypothetical protein
LERFKKDNLDHYSKTFGNIAIGVHGKELPKFNEFQRDWWTNSKGYNDMPNYQSAKYMQEDKNLFKVI